MEEKTDSNSTNSAGRDAVSKAPSLSCRVTVSFSLLPACLYRVSGFVSANGTKPKWQLWHGAELLGKRGTGKGGLAKIAAILRSRPLAALPMTLRKTHPLLHMPGLRASM